ncbi:peptidoglycan-binding protein [Streptomyces hokutonensis]|uniref:peptidoglycan-binding protein n=1 Tax=Streptomyces hokutonensis TaxID=1306990 RepID=UPI00037D5343|nr:peptidoglycan-binding protein [Streptomyces hokutonensis]
MYQSVWDSFIPFSAPLEGRIQFMYLDVKSLVSTGVGNLLDADDPQHFGTNPKPLPDIFTLDWYDKDTLAPATRAEIIQEYKTVKNSNTAHATIGQKEAITRLRISNASIDDLVRNKLSQFEQYLRGRTDFEELEDWPADAQLGLFSMAWGLGPAFKFPKFQAAAQQRDWLVMAGESKMTETGNPGVIPRNVRNGLLFTLADWNAAPPAGDLAQLVYNVSLDLDANMRSGMFPVPLNLAIGIQTALETLGFDPHGLDGVFGHNTRTALTSFQDSKGLPSTPTAASINDVPEATTKALADELQTLGFVPYP